MTYQLHQPVLVSAIISQFNPQANDILLDATLGTGGHAKTYLKASSPNGQVVGLDADPKAIATARQELAAYDNRVTYLEANFANLKNSLMGGGILPSKNARAKGDSTFPTIPSEPVPLSHSDFTGFSHILFDLGIGSHQITNSKSGFSWQSSGPLTMRYGTVGPLPDSALQSINYITERLGKYPDVTDLITNLKATELAEIIRTYGEERYAKRIAQAIKQQQPSTAQQLADAISNSTPDGYEHGRIHPATRTFQAFRIAVNRELEALNQALPQAQELLKPKGQLAVISFHSLEDRLVKGFLKKSGLTIITKKPITATPQEIKANPRSRSAKLRIAMRE